MADQGPTGPEYRADRAADLKERRRDPGPSGSRYDKDQAEVVIRRRLTTAILVAVGVLAVLNVYGTFVKNPQDRRTEDQAIRLSQYTVCEKSGNALREQVRHEFVDLKRDSLIPVFSGVASVIPDSPSKDILEDAVDRLHMRINSIEKRIPDADCLTLYPPLEGQTYPTN